MDRRLTQLARTDRPFEAALTLPGFVYHDANVWREELGHIFRRHWIGVAHVSALREPGRFVTANIGGDAVLVTRDDDGELRAFHNVCRHRGTRLVRQDAGRCARLTCPYHAWTYALDGRLAAAPGMDETPGFRRRDYPLLPLQVATHCGVVFVCADEGAEPLAQTFADFPDLTAFELDTLERAAVHDYHADTNWKLVCENYNECYHCRVAHPQLHRISRDASLPGFDHRGAHFTGGPMTITPPHRSMTSDGTTRRAPLPGMADREPPLTYYFNLFPTTLLSIAPDYAMIHYVWPKGPDYVHIRTEWLFTPAQMAAADFSADDAVEFWDTTNRQDWALCENALAGLRSGAHRPGRYQAGERCVHDFDRWYARTMRGR